MTSRYVPRPRPAELHCFQCGQPYRPPATGKMSEFCDACKAKHHSADTSGRYIALGARNEGDTPYRRADAGPPKRYRKASAAAALESVGGRLAKQVLRIEAAKPLLRLALMHRSWALVEAALNELDGTDRVVDIRSLVTAPQDLSAAPAVRPRMSVTRSF
jgi:hypothetical protein